MPEYFTPKQNLVLYPLIVLPGKRLPSKQFIIIMYKRDLIAKQK
jgi:hypothetical protein